MPDAGTYTPIEVLTLSPVATVFVPAAGDTVVLPDPLGHAIVRSRRAIISRGDGGFDQSLRGAMVLDGADYNNPIIMVVELVP